MVPRCSGYHYCITSFNKVRTQVLHRMVTSSSADVGLQVRRVSINHTGFSLVGSWTSLPNKCKYLFPVSFFFYEYDIHNKKIHICYSSIFKSGDSRKWKTSKNKTYLAIYYVLIKKTNLSKTLTCITTETVNLVYAIPLLETCDDFLVVFGVQKS